MLADHTLVIPTYNRPALLRRLVHYYRERAASMRLLVLDSSLAAAAEQNAKALAVYGEPVKHVAFPPTTPMATKLALGLGRVESSFASFCADDDLVFPTGLEEALAVLAGEPDHVCAHGLYLNFREAGHDVHLMREYAGASNDAHHAGARIFRLLQKYESLFYAVYRTPDLRDIASAVAELPTLHFQELFQSVSALIKGKVRRFPAFYAARQSCDAAEPGRDRWQTYYWFADDPAEFLEHYRAYTDAVLRFHLRHGAMPRLEAGPFRRALDLAHAVYFSADCPPAYFHTTLQSLWPTDPYTEVGKTDLFETLRGERTAARRSEPGRLARFLAHWRDQRAAAARSSLDAEAKRVAGTAWRCQLPSELLWWAETPGFRASYLELCRYLASAKRAQ